MRSILLAGDPGVGKSTVAQRILDSIPPELTVAGVLSGEIRVDGKRQGFTVRSVGGEPGLLASPEIPGGPRFGTLCPDGRRRLGISLAHLDGVVCSAVEASLNTVDLVVIDELGAMQAESARFRALVFRILESRVPLIATVGVQPHWWLDEVKADSSLSMIDLTRNNRDVIAEMATAYINRAWAL